MTTSGRSAAADDDELEEPDARGVDPVHVVEDHDARPVRLEQPLDVGGADLAQDRGRLGRIGRDVRGLRLPAVNAAARAMAAMAPPYRRIVRRVGVGVEQQLAGEAPGIDAVLVGDGLREDAREPVRLAAAVRHALGPGPGEAEPARLGLEVGDESRLAHPGVAGQQHDRAACRSAASAAGPCGSARSRRAARRAGSPSDARWTARPGQPELARSARRDARPTTGRAARPNRDRPPRGGRGRPGRSPRRAGSRLVGRVTGCGRPS